MRFLRSILALGAFFVVAVAISACGSGIGGDSVADVSGNSITTAAFNHWMFVAAKAQASQSPGAPIIVPTDPPDFKKCIAAVRKQVPTLAKTPDKQVKTDCNQLFTSLSGQVMDFLIRAYWYQAEAAKMHITVTDAQVQKVFNTAKQRQFPTAALFDTFLTRTGQTEQDILFRVRVNQIFMKLIAKHSSTVTAAQIQAFYSSHLSQFGTPPSRNMRIVLTKTRAQALAAKAALSSGQNWKAVAKKYSTDATTKKNGGLLVGVTPGQEDQALDKAAFSARINKVLGPVKGQFGYYVFEVTKIKKATQQTLAQASPLIRQTLVSQQQTTAQTAVDNQAKKDWMSKTTCRSTYAMSDCTGYKAPAAATTPGVVPPSTGATPPPASGGTPPPASGGTTTTK
jgi:foldase protein PrsA